MTSCPTPARLHRHQPVAALHHLALLVVEADEERAEAEADGAADGAAHGPLPRRLRKSGAGAHPAGGGAAAAAVLAAGAMVKRSARHRQRRRRPSAAAGRRRPGSPGREKNEYGLLAPPLRLL